MDASDVATVLGVQDLIARYAHRVDRGDFPGWADLFTEDAVFSVGEARFTGRAAIRSWLESNSSGPGGSHSTFNVSVVPVGPDRATAVADFFLSRREGGAGPWQAVVGGYYEDVLVRQDGQWRFAERHITFR
jgi:uncharacterized protein (TIGR02246 family)